MVGVFTGVLVSAGVGPTGEAVGLSGVRAGGALVQASESSSSPRAATLAGR